MTQNSQDRIVQICREYISQWQNSIGLMEKGSMRTHEVRDGRIVDTTEETILVQRKLIADLESTISKIETRQIS